MRTTPAEEGDPTAKLLVLAEAPGRVEMRKGQPLVGPSGDVFNDCLRVAGIPRSKCYILNVWPFMVPKDNKEDIRDHNSGELLWHHLRGFTELGLEEAKESLMKIRLSQANVIVPMGKVAFSLLHGPGKPKPIMKWRGSPLWSETIGRKYIPTIHPAATLHGTYLWRYLIQNDLAKAKLEMESRALRLPERDFLIAPTFEEAMHFMSRCQEIGCFATDIEVLNRQVSCFSMALSPKEAMTVPLVAEGGGHYWSEEDETDIWRYYALLMADPRISKINQNIVGFDAPFLFMQNNILTQGFLGDPMIAQSIMYPQFPKGLDFIASMHTREPYWKDEGKVWSKKKAQEVPWDQFQRYCAKDAAVAYEAWEVLESEMDSGGYWETYNMTVEMMGCLTYMSTRGLGINLKGLSLTSAEIGSEIARRQAKLNDLCQRDLNVSSPADCRRYFYEELGLSPYLGHNGSVTTDDKAMARLVRKASVGSAEAKLVQEIRALKKLKGTYLDTELDPDGRLRCSWNPRGTWTGRLSSSKTIFGTGLDLQNLHPSFKSFIVSDPVEGESGKESELHGGGTGNSGRGPAAGEELLRGENTEYSPGGGACNHGSQEEDQALPGEGEQH